jgi:hypothetical protein
VRFEFSAEQYKSFTLSESIKITRNVDVSPLADLMVYKIREVLNEYSLRDVDLEFIFMSRP